MNQIGKILYTVYIKNSEMLISHFRYEFERLLDTTKLYGTNESCSDILGYWILKVANTGQAVSKMLHVRQSHAIKHVLYYGVR